jgi:outer membrane protein assembly factor BamE (lipoprotein component of BamABCDE complex)
MGRPRIRGLLFPISNTLAEEVQDRTMNALLKLLTLSLLLVTGACLSAGTKAITEADVVSKIEVGKSTRADVTALLGYPLTASYGEAGEETWRYFYTTAAPKPTEFIPVVKAFTPHLSETIREFAVTFNPDGTVKNLGWAQPPQSPGPAS